ncbi:hypothetical protein FRACYDRAFT_206783 [Fragilariopsis cylindrus CCMP1102]|uniref:Uncharacterized protein n=1 Tax=Fragilariopsis cylindrus CCMP1102 TaxID=635003 RepID=A0A1E7FQK5_9STRA|nr:hypothetical protein FRACYDRAFT_206783 [Fragilariopsis cylindrus CCMP1102]|eukprot:OEU20073.1 hypothetical protein FRACYDRAFT_206783 [Fragilariopsis cylindrus CCMP1102]
MKIAVFSSLIACTAAFSQKDTSSRRDAMAGIAAAGAALVPAIANAAAGESPRFSVFGLLGDGTSYSEGGAYGSDQVGAGRPYSPYSLYPEASKDSLYKPDAPEYKAKKYEVLKETTKRLTKLEGYANKKEWREVNGELTRYMYETRNAVTFLAKSKEQKALATAFYLDIEAASGAAYQKNQAKCIEASQRSNISFAKLLKAL